MTSNKLKERGEMKWLVIHSEDESTPEIRVPGDFKPVLIREYVGKKGGSEGECMTKQIQTVNITKGK